VNIRPETVTAGEDVECHIDVLDIDKKVRAGWVELGYDNTHETSSTDTDGHSRTVETTDWVPVQTVSLFEGGVRRGDTVIHFAVPARGPSTVSNVIAWRVRALLDRQHGRDVSAEAELLVRPAPGMLRDRLITPAEMSTEIPITIEVANRELQPGGRLTGSVMVASSKTRKIRGLRVQLTRRRHDHAPGFSSKEHAVHAEVRLTDKRELRSGEPLTIPFEIVLPADAPECWEAEYNSQHWYLEAVADIPLRRDEISRIELLVSDPSQ